MSKNIRETILLMVLFVFVILIIQFTRISEINENRRVEVPKKCNVLVRIDIKGLSKKIFINELYSIRASDLIKNISKIAEEDTESKKDAKDPFTEFSEHTNDLNEPLEILTIDIKGEKGVFLRTKSQHKTSNSLLYKSNSNYLYIQLFGPLFQRKDVLYEINSTDLFTLSKAPTSDVKIYEKTNDKLDLKAYLNTSSKNIKIHLINKEENQVNKKISAQGLHFYAGANHLNAINLMNPLENKVKNFSINYFGLNSYNNPILFPNMDMLIEFEDSITINDFSSLLKSTIGSEDLSIHHESKKTGVMALDDVEFTYRLVDLNSIYLSTNNRILDVTKTSGSIELGGDLSQILKLNDAGWKGILANEMITGIPILNELKMLLSELSPVTTHSKNESIITLQLAGNQSIYSYLFSILSKI